nr:hypothetical protein [Tanacetum cinerariifolium]
MPIEAFGHAESPSLDAELALTDSETESDNVVFKIDIGDQDEGQVRPNPGNHDEGQARPNPDLLATNASTQQNPMQMDDEFTITAYLNLQENLKLPFEDPQHEEEPRKTNAEAEVQLMVSVLIHQDTSSVPPMTTSIIDLTTSQSDSPFSTSTTTLIITKTSFPPPQQSTADPILVKRIGASGALVHLSDDEDSENDHLPKAYSRKDWWKPLPEKEIPVTPEHAWTIPSSNVSDVENNWATALVSAYETPAEKSLLVKTGGMMNFLNWYCRQVNKTELTQADLEGQVYEVVKAFYPDVIHLQFQIEEFHKMLTDQVDWMNPEGDQVRFDVNQPLPLSGPSEFYIDRHASPSHQKEVRSHMRILSVVKIKAYSRYEYDYLSKIVLRRANLQEHTIAKKDFKNLYPSDFEDLNLLLLQGHLDHLPGYDKWMLSTAVKLWTQNLVIRQRVKDFQLGIESY